MKLKRSKARPLQPGYIGTILDNGRPPTNRILIGVPMTGLLRSEWVLARYGQVIPTNWSASDCIMWLDQYSPLRFSVADARNLIVTQAIQAESEWLFFIDHDTILPPVTLLRMNEYMLAGEPPILSGLYFTKSVPAEPLIYRGRGTGHYRGWKFGDKVWCDGHGMGCTLIHGSILKAVWDISEEYLVRGVRCRKVFESPAKSYIDPETGGWHSATGTEDLFFLHRIIDNDLLAKAGWKKYAKKKYPFLVDTSIFCKHIDWNGVQYPFAQDEVVFLKDEDKEKLGIK